MRAARAGAAGGVRAAGAMTANRARAAAQAGAVARAGAAAKAGTATGTAFAAVVTKKLKQEQRQARKLVRALEVVTVIIVCS